MSDETTDNPETDALLRDAEAAYDKGDQEWFNRQTTAALTFMWSIACDINRGAAWDDEVYEALADRGFFDEPTAEPGTRPEVVGAES